MTPEQATLEVMTQRLSAEIMGNINVNAALIVAQARIKDLEAELAEAKKRESAEQDNAAGS